MNSYQPRSRGRATDPRM